MIVTATEWRIRQEFERLAAGLDGQVITPRVLGYLARRAARAADEPRPSDPPPPPAGGRKRGRRAAAGSRALPKPE